MTHTKIDELMLAKALAIAGDPDASVQEMEWVRKFLNDYEHRHRDDGWKPDDPAASAEKLYGPMSFDEMPLNTQAVAVGGIE